MADFMTCHARMPAHVLTPRVVALQNDGQVMTVADFITYHFGAEYELRMHF
jgi:hypothetical protein